MSLLKAEALQSGYGKKNVIHDISVELLEGQIQGILGPNGCGKSTMIKALCRGIPYQGAVSICGRDIKKMTEKELAKLCTYVPQRSGLAIDISVLEVVLMGFYPHLGLLERPNKSMRKKACEILAQVGLEDAIYSNYMELSEGQKHMCILARSLVSDAKLLIMDEPDASLDFGVRNHVMQMILTQVKENNSGVLLSLHDTDLALMYCDKIYLMKDGRIIHSIKPQQDNISEMEEKLRELYGSIRLLDYGNIDKKIDENLNEKFDKNGIEKQERKLVMVQAKNVQKKFGCVIMASGLGKRFGADKLSAELFGKPMIQYVVEATEGLFAYRVVVTRNEKVKSWCENRGILVKFHSFPGRNDTVRLGLEEIEMQSQGEAIGCVFCPADMPFINPASIRSMLSKANDITNDIIRLSYQGKVGSPVLFGKYYFDDLKRLPEGKGGSEIIRGNQDKVIEVEVRSECELWDVDTQEDFEKVKSKMLELNPGIR